MGNETSLNYAARHAYNLITFKVNQEAPGAEWLLRGWRGGGGRKGWDKDPRS